MSIPKQDGLISSNIQQGKLITPTIQQGRLITPTIQESGLISPIIQDGDQIALPYEQGTLIPSIQHDQMGINYQHDKYDKPYKKIVRPAREINIFPHLNATNQIKSLLLAFIIIVGIIIIVIIVISLVKFVDDQCMAYTDNGICCKYGINMNGGCNIGICYAPGVRTDNGKCCTRGLTINKKKCMEYCNTNGINNNTVHGKCCEYGVTRNGNNCYNSYCTASVNNKRIGRTRDNKCGCLYGDAKNGFTKHNGGCNSFCTGVTDVNLNDPIPVPNSYNGKCCKHGLAPGIIIQNHTGKTVRARLCKTAACNSQNVTNGGKCCPYGVTIKYNRTRCNESCTNKEDINDTGLCCENGVASNPNYCNSQCKNCTRDSPYSYNGKYCEYGVARIGTKCVTRECYDKANLTTSGQCCTKGAKQIIVDGEPVGYACKDITCGAEQAIFKTRVIGGQSTIATICCPSGVTISNNNCFIPCNNAKSVHTRHGQRCCSNKVTAIFGTKCSEKCTTGLNPINTKRGYCCHDGIAVVDKNNTNQNAQRCNQTLSAAQILNNRISKNNMSQFFTDYGRFCKHKVANLGNHLHCNQNCTITKNKYLSNSGSCIVCPYGIAKNKQTCNAYCNPFKNTESGGCTNIAKINRYAMNMKDAKAGKYVTCPVSKAVGARANNDGNGSKGAWKFTKLTNAHCMNKDCHYTINGVYKTWYGTGDGKNCYKDPKGDGANHHNISNYWGNHNRGLYCGYRRTQKHNYVGVFRDFSSCELSINFDSKYYVDSGPKHNSVYFASVMVNPQYSLKTLVEISLDIV